MFVNNNPANRKKCDCQNLPDRFRWCIINIIEQQFSMQQEHRHRTTVFFLCQNENVSRSHFQMTDVATRSCQHHRSPSDRYKNRINDPIPWINFRPNLAFHLIEYDELNRLSSIRSGVMVRKRLCTLAQNFLFNIYRFADNLRLIEESSFTFLYITESRAVIQITGSFFPITLILK